MQMWLCLKSPCSGFPLFLKTRVPEKAVQDLASNYFLNLTYQYPASILCEPTILDLSTFLAAADSFP